MKIITIHIIFLVNLIFRFIPSGISDSSGFVRHFYIGSNIESTYQYFDLYTDDDDNDDYFLPDNFLSAELPKIFSLLDRTAISISYSVFYNLHGFSDFIFNYIDLPPPFHFSN